jgi:transposase
VRAIADARRKFDQEFRQGAVRIVREAGKPIAQVAREFGINSGTLARWVAGGGGPMVVTGS